MPSKHIRKIIRIGNSSLGVTIPKEWLLFYDLSYGDSVEIISNGVVTIKPKGD